MKSQRVEIVDRHFEIDAAELRFVNHGKILYGQFAVLFFRACKTGQKEEDREDRGKDLFVSHMTAPFGFR